MIKGFSLLEVIVALTISLSVLTFVVANVGESIRNSKKVISNQQRMESIFQTIDVIRSDLTKCGMRLQDPARFLTFPLFENSDVSFKVTYGTDDESLLETAFAGTNIIKVNRNDYFQLKRKILIYDPGSEQYEVNEIKGLSGSQVTLTTLLKNNYPVNSVAVILKEIEYKHYLQQNTLKRKVNAGYFQPLIDNVTDFSVTFYPEVRSVFYRIEVNEKEQVRGYIFLPHMEAGL
ncbi:MAG: type II secretion system protein J [Candidatus Omnitrophota bacterium]